jgi:FixJ family two-component response regulator
VNSNIADQPEHSLSLLIVDDEPASMRALCDTLEYEGYRCYGFTVPAEALAAMRERPFDLLLADLQMPGTNGIDLMKSAQLIDPTLVAVIMTGHGALDTAIAAMKAGALDYIQKPLKLVNALPVIERALAVRQLRIEKKKLEDNVRQRTEELKIANRELEAFSYSVSHDLRSPLRAVSVFSQALLAEHAPSLNDEGKRLLQNVSAGAAHMDRLITDLLRLAQLNRQPLHKSPVKFTELAQTVIDGMALERANRAIEFVIADFPTWQVDGRLIQHVPRLVLEGGRHRRILTEDRPGNLGGVIPLERLKSGGADRRGVLAGEHGSQERQGSGPSQLAQSEEEIGPLLRRQ